MLLQAERLSLPQSPALSPQLFVVLGPFVSDMLWKPQGNIFLITKTNICCICSLRLDFWSAQTWIFAAVRKGFLPGCLYICLCSVNNFDFLTLRRFHLSMLGLLRNNCQFITQVGVSKRLCIVFSCRQIKKNLPLTEFYFEVGVRVRSEEEMTRVAAKIVEQVGDIYGS